MRESGSIVFHITPYSVLDHLSSREVWLQWFLKTSSGPLISDISWFCPYQYSIFQWAPAHALIQPACLFNVLLCCGAVVLWWGQNGRYYRYNNGPSLTCEGRGKNIDFYEIKSCNPDCGLHFYQDWVLPSYVWSYYDTQWGSGKNSSILTFRSHF